jgi:hypothetical protein
MDRFDLEDRINKLHNIVDDINDISFGILEGGMSKDEIASALDGLAVMTEVKLKKLFDVFIQVHKLDQYSGLDYENE